MSLKLIPSLSQMHENWYHYVVYSALLLDWRVSSTVAQALTLLS